MALTYVDSASAQGNQTSSPVTITVPGTVQPGDLMIVNVKGRESVALPIGFNILQMGVTPTESTYTYATIGWGICRDPAPTTLDFTSGGNNIHVSMVAYRCDADEDYFFDGVTSASAVDGLNITPGNIVTTQPALVLMCPSANSFDNGQIVTYSGASYTIRANLTTNMRLSTAIFEYAVGAGTTALPTVTLSRTERRGFYAVAIYSAPVFSKWSHGTTGAVFGGGYADAYNGNIYLMGGSSSTTGNRMYDPVLDTYTTKASVPASLLPDPASICTDGDYIYALRGTSTAFYRYDPNANTWATLNSAPYTATTSWIVPDGLGNLWAAGGSGTAGTTPLMKFNIAAGTWSTPSLAVSNGAYKRAVLAPDGIIYSMGGVISGVSQTTVEKLDPVAETVTSGTALPAARRAGAIGIKGPSIFYATGVATQAIPTHWEYDVDTATWSVKHEMPLGVSQPGAVVVGTNFYVIGGYDITVTQSGRVQIWNAAEVNGGVLQATGRAVTSLYADGGRVDAIGRAVAEILSAEVEYENSVQSDSMLDIGSTGSAITFDALAPSETLAPGTGLAPGGDF